MEVMNSPSPFGSRTRTRTLLALRLLRESYSRELARLLGASLSTVQKALVSLERDGVVAGRAVGRTRVYRIDPRAFARPELERYLDRLLGAQAELRARVAALRRRPRRSGKPL
jgi:DNA-binding transcriptional ArsR family regulator